MKVLLSLAQHPGEVVRKEEILRQVWPETFVTDEVLTRAVSELRKVFGDNPRDATYIQTIPKGGYRLIAPVIMDAADSRTKATSKGLYSIFGTVHHKGAVFATSSIFVLIVAATGYLAFLPFRAKPAIDIRHATIRRLTEHGQAGPCCLAVSRDGRWIGYIRRRGDRGLHVKQILAGAEVIVVPPKPGFFSGLEFTPDANYLYYAHTDSANSNVTDIYSVPSLGGPSRMIVRDGLSPTVSPDGAHIAYIRFAAKNREDQLLIANADGSGEDIISRQPSGYHEFSSNPSWSGTGALIAIGEFNFTDNTIGQIIILTTRGKLVRSFSLPVIVGALAWLPDDTGMFLSGNEKSAPNPQIWFQPYPTGTAVKITNDLNHYGPISVTGDGKSLVTTQSHPEARIFVGDSPSILSDKIDWKLSAISEETAGYSLSWTAAGNLLQQDEANHVYMTATDGSNRVRLLENDTMDFVPTACGAGEFAIVTRLSEDNKIAVWRVNTTTGELKQLTRYNADISGSCTPDGKWMVYLRTAEGLNIISKLPTEGGNEEELARGRLGPPVVSPDGTRVAYISIDRERPNRERYFVVRKLEGNVPITEFNAPSDSHSLGWTPVGDGLTFLQQDSGPASLYMQPITGGAPLRLMHFDEEPAWITAYAWSRDGKKVAVTRARDSDTDVIMFTGFR